MVLFGVLVTQMFCDVGNKLDSHTQAVNPLPPVCNVSGLSPHPKLLFIVVVPFS